MISLARLLTNTTTANGMPEDDPILVDDGLSVTEYVLAAGLFFLMVGVGVSCKLPLMRKMLASPKALKAAAVGVACQFVVMPLVAWSFTVVFRIQGYTALGFVVAGCMPGGSTSNVYTIWSKGILELSVFMTILSTLAAFAMTPLWIYVLGHAIEGIHPDNLPFGDIAVTFAFLVVPLSLGMSLNLLSCKETIHKWVEQALSVLAILFFGGAIVGVLVENPNSLKQYATWEVYVSAILYFPIATGIAYALVTCLKFQPAVKRTILIETGFQNLALAMTIGQKTVETQSQIDQALPFPVLYAVLMYVWAGILIPLFRWQAKRNQVEGIKDRDSDFIYEENDDGDSEDVEKEGDEETPPEATSDVALSVDKEAEMLGPEDTA